MRAADLLVAVERIGARLEARGDALRLVSPRGAVAPELLDHLRAQKAQILRILGGEQVRTHAGDDLFDTFLSDSLIPAAVFRSKALGRDFVLARDESALETLTADDQKLPILYFRDCASARMLGLEGLSALLRVRSAFGPAVTLRAVEGGSL